MNCSYKKIQELVNNKKIYNGKIITDKRSYKIEIKLEQNRSYIDEIEKLYYTFQKNDIPWKTINNPYANKFFDIILTKCETMSEEEEIKEISFNLEEFEKYKSIDIIPLWNIERLKEKSTIFPSPTEDRINFEHIIPLNKKERESGFLVETEEEAVRYIKRTQEKLIIISTQEKSDNWNMLKILQPKEQQELSNEYKLFSNRRKSSFINKFSQKQASIIRTKGEINRIVNSFQVSKYFQLKDIEIRDKQKEILTTYDMNFFIVDDIRIGIDKKIMMLKFETTIEDNFIIYDVMSFLVSEIQMYFPEYKCAGELI